MSPALSFGTQNFTTEFWFNATGTSSQNTFVGNYTPNAATVPTWGWNLYSAAGVAKVSFYSLAVVGSSNAGVAWTPTNTFTTGSWNHYALVRNGAVFTGYLNGAVDGSYISSSNTALDAGNGGAGYINVGGSGYNTASPNTFNGYIDDFRITMGVARYTAAFTPPTLSSPITQALTIPTINASAGTTANYDPLFGYTVLLLHGDGNFTDSSAYATTMRTGGTPPTTSATTYKFGNGSLSFSGVANNWLYTPTSIVYSLLSNNFTIEMWIYLTTSANTGILGNDVWTGTFTAGSNWVLWQNSGGVINFQFTASVNLTTTISTGNWYHLAIVRNGSAFAMYVNGASVATTTSSSALTSGTDAIYVGGYNQTQGGNLATINGFLDDVRITNGYARYTTNFTPPVAPFPNGGAYEYPPMPMTAATTTFTGLAYGISPGNGYTASASSTYLTSYPYYAFDKLVSITYGWGTNATNYNLPSSVNTTWNGGTNSPTTLDGGTVYRDWIQIQLSVPIPLTGYYLSAMNYVGKCPASWIIAGSMDGSKFTTVTTGSFTWAYDLQTTPLFTVNSQTSWLYYRLIYLTLGGSYVSTGANGGTELAEWRLSSAYPIQEYPPAALSGILISGTATALPVYECIQSAAVYGNGMYLVSAGSAYTGLLAYNPFDKSNSTVWANSGSYNTSVPYNYTGALSTTVSGTTVLGDWLQIKLPTAIVLTSYSIQARNDASYTQSPAAWYIAGSNDGITWYQVDIQSGIAWTQNAVIYFSVSAVSNPSAFSYYRIVMMNSSSTTGFVAFCEWRLFGYPAPLALLPPPISFPLDGMSAAALATTNGLFSCKRLLTSYTGPVLQLRSSAGGANQIFYADGAGNLTSGPNGTGTPFATWLGTATTAYVAVWYDQSGQNRHATQSLTTAQPSYNPLLQLIDFSTPNSGAYMYMPSTTVPTNTIQSTISLRIGKFNNTNVQSSYGYLFCSGTGGTTGATSIGYIFYYVGTPSYINTYGWSQWGGGVNSGATEITGDRVTFRVGGTTGVNTSYVYVNGIQNGSQAIVTGSQACNGSATPLYPDVLGGVNTSVGTPGTTSPYNGQLYYISMFASSISTADQAIAEAQ